MKLVCFVNIHGQRQHFSLTNEKLVYCFHEESFFSDKVNLKTVSEPFIFPRHTRNFGAKKDFFIHNILYILHPYKQLVLNI